MIFVCWLCVIYALTMSVVSWLKGRAAWRAMKAEAKRLGVEAMFMSERERRRHEACFSEGEGDDDDVHS